MEYRTAQRLASISRLLCLFCLIANGAYIGLGSFGQIGDAGDLLRHGLPQWLLIAFGVAAIAGGLLIWHLALERRRMQPRVNDPPERDP